MGSGRMPGHVAAACRHARHGDIHAVTGIPYEGISLVGMRPWVEGERAVVYAGGPVPQREGDREGRVMGVWTRT